MGEGHTERLESALTGRYRIVGELGEGGMATVYLAEDVKHERKVALKILRPELAAVIGADRFLSEIKTTANLQHPHILPLFDSGEAGGYLYYVMPFVDGETLRDRLDREKQLGVEESIRIARDVADALDYAHRHGVIHRDIKPGNILLHDGRPVVSDFGIALAVSAAGGGRMTETGMSLGTPHYMSPEQASADRDLSARSDVYSLGCVLYEMLAGQPPHTGPSAQSILVHILTKEPAPLTELRRTVPPNVASAVAKSIEKLPADRFESAREFRDALDDAGFAYGVRPGAAGPGEEHVQARRAAPRAPLSSSLLAASTVLLAGTSLLLGWMVRRATKSGAPRGGIVSFVLTDDLEDFYPPIIGSDGSIAVPRPLGGLDILVPGATELVPLPGADDVLSGAFSPDAVWLAFVEPVGEGFALRRMPAAGGPVSTLWETPVGLPFGDPPVAWADDGWIYVALENGLGRLPQTGGPMDTVLALDPGSVVSRVSALPGGAAVLFTLGFSDVNAENRVVMLDLSSGDTATVVRDGFDAQWVDSGHLVYAHSGGALYALPFDLRRRQRIGPPVLVLDEVAVLGNVAGRFTVSPNGTLAYARGAPTATGAIISFALLSLDGAVEPLRLEPTDHSDVALSPDGSRIAYIRQGQVWLYDLDRGTNRRFTEEGDNHHNPVWSPDGREIAFNATYADAPPGELFVRPVDGSAPVRHVNGRPNRPDDFPTQWLEDGSILFDGQGAPDIFRAAATGDAPAVPLLEADWAEVAPRVSPDGRWLAYASNEDEGAFHLFVRRWPELTGRTQLTSGEEWINPGDNGLAWSADSRTLYFSRTRRLWTATLTGPDAGSFDVRDTGIEMPGPIWDRHPDGRLLVHSTPGDAPDGEPEGPRLVVVANWIRTLEERLGGSP